MEDFLVYDSDVWVGDQAGQKFILGMNFYDSVAIHLDLADGKVCLPDEVCIDFSR